MTTLENVSRKHQVLLHRLEDSRLRYEALSSTVGEAKNRIEMEPHVISIMEELQRREHERAVGAYEELLTLFLRDVLPGHRDVVMDLRTERGLPALDVYLRKGEDMPLEDALTGTGGSVTNILSAGLRFIALIRSGRRPFLVLDEPDCWIKPELAPKFAAVVQSVAEQLGVQVLMISHHDEQMFENMLPHRVRVEKNGTQLFAQWAPTSSTPEWQEDQSGLRSIELINFQSHAHTIMPLSPGLTLINGDNDIGKSAIVSALRDVFDAGSNDQHIRHGQKSAKVILDFGPDKVLSWERFRKGSTKVVYELREAGASSEIDPIRKSVGARDVPEWVREFGIGLIDDMDVQLANQKDPVFLLSDTARERAKALAIGGENAHVQEMLAIGKQEISEARLTVRTGEKQLETLHRSRQILQPVEKRTSIVSSLEETSRALEEDARNNEKLLHLLTQWTRARRRQMALSPMEGNLVAPPEAPADDTRLAEMGRRWKLARGQRQALAAFSDNAFAASTPDVPALDSGNLVGRWRRAGQVRAILSRLGDTHLPPLPDLPEVTHTNLAQRWKRAQDRSEVLARLTHTQGPTIPQFDEDAIQTLSRTIQQWAGSLQSSQAQTQEIAQLDAAIEHVKQQMEAIGECPTCGRPMGHDHNLRDEESD